MPRCWPWPRSCADAWPGARPLHCRSPFPSVPGPCCLASAPGHPAGCCSGPLRLLLPLLGSCLALRSACSAPHLPQVPFQMSPSQGGRWGLCYVQPQLVFTIPQSQCILQGTQPHHLATPRLLYFLSPTAEGQRWQVQGLCCCITAVSAVPRTVPTVGLAQWQLLHEWATYCVLTLHLALLSGHLGEVPILPVPHHKDSALFSSPACVLFTG